jgi:hypothetical protein
MKVTQTQKRQEMGIYQPTQIDEQKNKSNRLTSICGKYYTVQLLTGQTLEIVGKRAWNKWSNENEYVCDF